MELNIFNINLNINDKNRDIIPEFVKELSEYLEKTEKQELSILQQVENEQKITVMYRDKMQLERNKILNNYAKETADKGEMYYIYNKDLEKSSYNLCICKDDKSHVVIETKEIDLPHGASVDSVLRLENGKYILDVVGTKEVAEQIKEMVVKLLEEQTKYLDSQRIEGHIYEVGEIEKDRVWLFNITKNDGQGFEEINFPKELLNKVTEGNEVVYNNGNYIMNISE